MAHHTSPGRGLLRSASLLASAVFAASACGPDKPVTPPPPLVTVNVPEGNVVGTKVNLSVTVTGCDTVQSSQLFDQGEALKALPPNTGETLVELQSHEIRYKRGIAAHMSLTARAVCSDGRQSESQPVAVTFFPVESVLAGDIGVQVVTDYFIADGSGSSVSFIGCGNPASGFPNLYRVNVNGEVTQQVQMPFVCNASTTITEKQPSTGIRWVWTPGAGVMAINEAFQIISSPSPQMPLASLTVDPEGHALVLHASTGHFMRLKKDATRAVDPSAMKLWEYTEAPGNLIGTPVFRPDLGDVLLPMFTTSSGDTTGDVSILTLNYKTGVFGSDRPVHPVYVDGTPPAASISADGQTVYLAFRPEVGPDRTVLVSCPTDGTLCERTQRWQSEALQGRVVLLLPYAGTNRLAAIAPQHVYFINPATGAVLNKDGAALSPTGAYSVLQVQQGVGTREDFYLLNGAGTSQTTEIVAVDRAENGELFRYQVPSGDLTVAVDASGALWMRVNQKLVKALPLSDYRNAQK